MLLLNLCSKKKKKEVYFLSIAISKQTHYFFYYLAVKPNDKAHDNQYIVLLCLFTKSHTNQASFVQYITSNLVYPLGGFLWCSFVKNKLVMLFTGRRGAVSQAESLAG